MQFRISPPFTSGSDLVIKGKVGCEGAMPHSFEIHNTAEKIERAYRGIMNAKSLGLLSDEQLGRFPRDVLGVEEQEQMHVHRENDGAGTERSRETD